jgi:hypothetical protein
MGWCGRTKTHFSRVQQKGENSSSIYESIIHFEEWNPARHATMLNKPAIISLLLCPNLLLTIEESQQTTQKSNLFSFCLRSSINDVNRQKFYFLVHCLPDLSEDNKM